MSPKNQLEQEKRLRREIANSNERRRMQSINAGFESLKVLIPHHEGEKLSKVCRPVHFISGKSSFHKDVSRLVVFIHEKIQYVVYKECKISFAV